MHWCQTSKHLNGQSWKILRNWQNIERPRKHLKFNMISQSETNWIDIVTNCSICSLCGYVKSKLERLKEYNDLNNGTMVHEDGTSRCTVIRTLGVNVLKKILGDPRRSKIRDFWYNWPWPTILRGRYFFGPTRPPLYV